MISAKAPDGMIEAALTRLKSKPYGDSLSVSLSGDLRWPGMQSIIESAAEWLKENFPLPTNEQAAKIGSNWAPKVVSEPIPYHAVQGIIMEWARTGLFASADEEVPDALKDLIGEQEPPFPPGKYQWLSLETQRERILEAYRRGKKSTETKSATDDEIPDSIFKTLYARGTVEGPGCTCVTVEDAVKAAKEAYRLGKEGR